MFKRLVVLAMLLLGVACASAPAQTTAVPPAAVSAAPSTTALSYRLGTGDKLRVIVFGEEKLSGEFVVDGTGMVALPLIGSVPALGSSARDLEAKIADSLRGRYIANPRVSVEVLTFRPFYILGEVNAPGEYPYSDGLTILNAVARAQGFSIRANQRTVMIRRAGSQTEERVKVGPGTPVQPGDTIRVLERWF